MDIMIKRKDINLEALDAELRAALPEVISGVSLSPAGVTVHFTGRAILPDQTSARQIVLAHDPARLTPAQEKAKARADKLRDAQRDKGSDLDVSQFKDALLNELARKVAWLEQEIIALREG
jgi:hypothetical protein